MTITIKASEVSKPIELEARDYCGICLITDTRHTVVRLYCRYTRRIENCELLVVPAGKEACQAQDGPMVPGPWGGVVAMSTVISAYRMIGPERVIEAQEGDRFIIGGQTYEIRDDRPMDYPRLVAVDKDTSG